MCLSKQQVHAILAATADMVGPDASVWLFGSRLDDAARGGRGPAGGGARRAAAARRPSAVDQPAMLLPPLTPRPCPIPEGLRMAGRPAIPDDPAPIRDNLATGQTPTGNPIRRIIADAPEVVRIPPNQDDRRIEVIIWPLDADEAAAEVPDYERARVDTIVVPNREERNARRWVH